MRSRASFRRLVLLPALALAGCQDDPGPLRSGGPGAGRPDASLESAAARTLARGRRQ